MYGTTTGVIKGDTRSLDTGSYGQWNPQWRVCRANLENLLVMFRNWLTSQCVSGCGLKALRGFR